LECPISRVYLVPLCCCSPTGCSYTDLQRELFLFESRQLPFFRRELLCRTAGMRRLVPFRVIISCRDNTACKANCVHAHNREKILMMQFAWLPQSRSHHDNESGQPEHFWVPQSLCACSLAREEGGIEKGGMHEIRGLRFTGLGMPRRLSVLNSTASSLRLLLQKAPPVLAHCRGAHCWIWPSSTLNPLSTDLQ